jgi:hypothetical protein
MKQTVALSIMCTITSNIKKKRGINMNKIIKLSSIAVITLCLSVCSRNVEEDTKQCSNAIATLEKQKTSGGTLGLEQIQKMYEDNADACFSAYENTPEKKDSVTHTKYLMYAYQGFLAKGDVNQAMKACNKLHELLELKLSKMPADVPSEFKTLGSATAALVCNEKFIKAQINQVKMLETGKKALEDMKRLF